MPANYSISPVCQTFIFFCLHKTGTHSWKMQIEAKQGRRCKEIYSECSFLKIAVIPTKPDFPQFFFHPPSFPPPKGFSLVVGGQGWERDDFSYLEMYKSVGVQCLNLLQRDLNHIFRGYFRHSWNKCLTQNGSGSGGLHQGLGVEGHYHICSW